MAFEITEVQQNQKEIDVYKVLGNDMLAGKLSVTYRPFSGRQKDSRELLKAGEDERYLDLGDMSLKELVEEKLISWNVTFQSEPVPLNVEAVLEKVPPQVITDIMSAVALDQTPPNLRKGRR